MNAIAAKPRHCEAPSLDPSNLPTGKLVVRHASGCWLFDDNGKCYFDATGGSGAVNLGHQHPELVSVMREQAEQLVHTGWNMRTNVREDLVERLGNLSPFETSQVLLTVTGAEAIEAMLKVARAATGRRGLVAFSHGYHGKTAGALAATWQESFRRYAEVALDSVQRLPFPTTPDSEESCLREVEELLRRLCGQRPAVLLIEPVQVSGGVYAASDQFLRRLRELSSSSGVLLAYDEIYTGFGRCGDGPFVACRPGLRPDLLVLGKALGNGLPISAVVGSPDVMAALPSGGHTSTFSGQPLACRVGVAVIDLMRKLQPWRRATSSGDSIRALLEELGSRGRLTSPRGQGLILGFDCLGQDGQPSAAAAERFVRAAFDHGVVLRYGGMTGATVKVTPPLLIGEVEHIHLENAFRAAEAEIP